MDTFKELERLQKAALDSVKNQALESLAAVAAKQQEVMAAIAREKADLRPYLDQWEGLAADVRTKLRAGRPGDILTELEAVAQGIAARHKEMFGADEGEAKKAEEPPANLSNMINIYRSLQ